MDYAYTSEMLDMPTSYWRRRLVKDPRKILYALHRDFAVHLLGGSRLLVLAR